MISPFAPGMSHTLPTDDLVLDQATIVELFERRVILSPCSIALEVNDKSFTYMALDARATRLAQRLKTTGCRMQRRGRHLSQKNREPCD